MFCPKCGTQLNDTAAFCNACGTPVGVAPVANNAPQGYNQPPQGYNQMPNYNQPPQGYNQMPYQPQVRTAPSPLMLGKVVSAKDSNFLFVVIAGILAFFAAYFLNGPVVGSDYGTGCVSLSDIHDSSVLQIIFTILTFVAVAFLFFPYIKGVNLKLNILNLVVPTVILAADVILFFVLYLAMPSLISSAAKLAFGGWLFYLCSLGAIALLVWQTIRYAKSVKR